MTMDPTTLITFLYRTAPSIRTVELIGSWDNFQRSYRMHADRRRGPGIWTGCFKFTDIIFDGDMSACSPSKPTTNYDATLNHAKQQSKEHPVGDGGTINSHGNCSDGISVNRSTSKRCKPRAGALKQGGTYWYFYRLDDTREVFDEYEPHTTACPLLPGQRMNILDVPCEVSPPPTKKRSLRRSVSVDAAASASAAVAAVVSGISSSVPGVSTASALLLLPPGGGISPTIAGMELGVQTLDPNDKFAALEPPPISRVHGRCVSDLALNGRLEHVEGETLSLPHTPLTPPSNESPQRPRSPTTTKRQERYYDSNAAFESTSQRSTGSLSSRSSVASDTHSSVIDAETVGSRHYDDDDASSYNNDDSEASREGANVRGGPRKKRSFWNPFIEPLRIIHNALPVINESSRPSTSRGETSPGWTAWSDRRELNPPSPAKLTDPPMDAMNETFDPQSAFRTTEPRNLSYSSSPERVGRHGTTSDVESAEDEGEVCSPSFSAVTVSSTDGDVKTPFRLSLGLLNRGANAGDEQSQIQATGVDVVDATNQEPSVKDQSYVRPDGPPSDLLEQNNNTDAADLSSSPPAGLSHTSLTQRLKSLRRKASLRSTRNTTIADEDTRRRKTAESVVAANPPTRAPPPPPLPPLPASLAQSQIPPSSQSRQPSSLPPLSAPPSTTTAKVANRSKPTFTGYSLPRLAEESFHSLGKVSSTTPSRHEGGELGASRGGDGLTEAVATAGDENLQPSFSENIFDELGYLGGSIS